MADVDTKLERICVVTGNVEKLKALAKKKKELFSTLLDGWTPLHVAAFNLKQEVVEHLLSQVGGLGNAIEPESGCTALHMLAWRGSPTLVRAFVEQGNVSLSVRSKVCYFVIERVLNAHILIYFLCEYFTE
jgi:ankyrin repeat protein